jgi:hypothetical protein
MNLVAQVACSRWRPSSCVAKRRAVPALFWLCFYVMLVLLKVINLAVLCLRTDVPPCV